MNSERKKKLKELQKRLHIKFRSIDRLNEALTHISYSHEILRNESHYEKLEFLGDAVLSLVINEYLYKTLKNLPVGELAKFKSIIVSDFSLFKISESLFLGDYLNLGKGEKLSGGDKKSSILADVLEAIIGAYYLDSGLKKVRKFILSIFAETIKESINFKIEKDYKSKLQEFVQREYKVQPEYFIIGVYGPEHKKTYEIGVKIKGIEYGRGTGSSKKNAEKLAAKKALKNLIEVKDKDIN